MHNLGLMLACRANVLQLAPDTKQNAEICISTRDMMRCLLEKVHRKDCVFIIEKKINY